MRPHSRHTLFLSAGRTSARREGGQATKAPPSGSPGAFPRVGRTCPSRPGRARGTTTGDLNTPTINLTTTAAQPREHTLRSAEIPGMMGGTRSRERSLHRPRSLSPRPCFFWGQGSSAWRLQGGSSGRLDKPRAGCRPTRGKALHPVAARSGLRMNLVGFERHIKSAPS